MAYETQLAAVEAFPKPGLTNDSLENKYQNDEQQVLEKLPTQYKEFQALFSKRASDTLAEPRLGKDHKFELTESNKLTFEPLRRMSEEQLHELKRYILDNLHKGFITPSNAPYAAPILFAKKGWWKLTDVRRLSQAQRLNKEGPVSNTPYWRDDGPYLQSKGLY